MENEVGKRGDLEFKGASKPLDIVDIVFSNIKIGITKGLGTVGFPGHNRIIRRIFFEHKGIGLRVRRVIVNAYRSHELRVSQCLRFSYIRGVEFVMIQPMNKLVIIHIDPENA